MCVYWKLSWERRWSTSLTKGIKYDASHSLIHMISFKNYIRGHEMLWFIDDFLRKMLGENITTPVCAFSYLEGPIWGYMKFGKHSSRPPF